MEQKLKPLASNKKGQIGLDVVQRVMVTFLIISVIGVAVILALVSLRDSSIFDDGSSEQNDTTSIVGNVTGGLVDFFSNTGTIFAILVVVVIILAITIIILAVRRFGGGANQTGL